MSWIAERLVAVLALVFVAAAVTTAVASGEPSALLVGGAALVVLALLASRLSATTVGTGYRYGIVRTRYQRQSTLAEPAPQHPDTDGRPRSRAPSRVPAAA